MTTFDDREKSFEAKFAHDEDLRFRTVSRRDKLLGMWAADKLGLKGKEAETYALEVVKAEFQEPGDHDVQRKVAGDLAKKGVKIDDRELRRVMDELMAKAKQQIMSETKA